MAKRSIARSSAVRKASRTWIVVADGGHARILESGYPGSGVTVRLDVMSGATERVGKLAADRLPRTQESGCTARHGIEPRLTLKAYERRVFAARLADDLTGGQANFDQLVLVAPVRFLSLMRDALSDAVLAKISETRGKDLTWMTDAQVLDHLGSIGEQVRRARQSA